MWPEPLTAAALDIDEYRFRVELSAGPDAQLVATAWCLVNQGARSGYLAEISIDPDGGARQKRRAIVLLVRECCRHAQALGITSCHAELSQAMRALGERLAGVAGEPAGARYRVTVDLAEMRSRLLSITDADGNDP
jgi:hypothetical protein